MIGPSTRETMASVVLKGSAYQRGVQYGKAIGVYLERFYHWFVQKEPVDILTADYRLMDLASECLTVQQTMSCAGIILA